MLTATFNFLGLLANQKKIVGGWLVLLTLALGQVGEKVYVDRTREITVIQTELDQIQTQLRRMEGKLDVNGERLENIIIEQARVRQELAASAAITGVKLEGLEKADAKLQADLLRHMSEDKKPR